MRAVVQRVTAGSVTVDQKIVGSIDKGFVVLLGVGEGDTEEDAKYIVSKISHLRVFEDADGKMNESLKDEGGSVLVVSQFTLYGDVRKGRRPSFDKSAPPDVAKALYEKVIDLFKDEGIPVETGIFQAHMEVALTNDGPVTLLIDSNKEF